jgi:RNA polymerase sigma factor (sigma-70 family)
MMHLPVDKPISAADRQAPSNQRRLAEEAAEWLGCLEEGDEKEKALFTEWLSRSPHHVEAFLKTCALHRELAKLAKAKVLSRAAADVVVEHPAVVLARAKLPARASDPVSHLAAVYPDYPGLRALVLRRVRDPDVAADVLQDTAVTTLEKLRSGEIAHPDNTGAYLYRVALNHLRAYRRRQCPRRYAFDIEQLELFADEAASPEREFGRAELARAARRMLNEIASIRDRDLLIRCYLWDQEPEQICRELKLSEEHFHRVLFHARNRFRELLMNRGFDFGDRPQKPVASRVFISYDWRDRSRLDQFHVHLANLRHEGVVTTWVDREVSAAVSAGGEAISQLEKSSLFVPMVSRELLNSEYCYDLEMTRALSLEESGQIKIAPVILDDCDWRHSPFGRFKPLPEGKPIEAWLKESAAFEEVMSGLRRQLQAPEERIESTNRVAPR